MLWQLLVAWVLETAEQFLAVETLPLVALLPVLAVSAVAADPVRSASRVEKGSKAHLLILLILSKLLGLILLLLSRLLSLGCRLGELCLGVHLLYFCKIGVPETVSSVDELALLGAPT